MNDLFPPGYLAFGQLSFARVSIHACLNCGARGFEGTKSAKWCASCKEAHPEAYKAWRLASNQKSKRQHARRAREQERLDRRHA
jgi:hypothetical protein